mgnify:CR=1 FL=1
MIRIPCPFCGDRDHSEFTYGGDGSIKYPEIGASKEAWISAVFERQNVHLYGCRMWMIVERDTTTHEIFRVWPADQRIIEK